jgi:cobalt-zinc-cadmium efflux system membrane fusion protein
MAKKIGLQIHEAEGGQVSRSVVFPAEIKLNRDRSAAVSPRYASIVRQVFAEIGDAVKKGDVLASLENRETLAVYTVSAPLDGIVVSKHVSIGESAGEERVLYEVADLSSVWADISIFPQYRHQIEKGQRVLLSASDGHCVETAIEYISPLVATDTRTLQARCVLEGAADDFTPGAFVRAEVAVETVEADVRVEKDAVQTLEGRPVVFIADEQDFESRDVELGLSDRRFVEIKAGLAPGEKYVAKGAFELKAEMVTSGLDPHAGHGH